MIYKNGHNQTDNFRRDLRGDTIVNQRFTKKAANGDPTRSHTLVPDAPCFDTNKQASQKEERRRISKITFDIAQSR
ncbi:MAG: hypothetical protein WAZ18_00430 [Alphaproteobacteria bacterium]